MQYARKNQFTKDLQRVLQKVENKNTHTPPIVRPQKDYKSITKYLALFKTLIYLLFKVQ